MLQFLLLSFGTLVRLFRAQQGLLLENLALRQQLAVQKRRHPRPSFGTFDRLYWVVARRVWSGWKQSLIIVSPETGLLSIPRIRIHQEKDQAGGTHTFGSATCLSPPGNTGVSTAADQTTTGIDG
jgi:hypothetical protein